MIPMLPHYKQFMHVHDEFWWLYGGLMVISLGFNAGHGERIL